MKGQDFMKTVSHAEMPDKEQMRENCIRQVAEKTTIKRGIWVKRFAPVAACAVIIIAAAVAFPNFNSNFNGGLIDEPRTQSGQSQTNGEPNASNPIDAVPAPKIVINEVTKNYAGKLNIELLQNDFVSMNKQEAVGLYGFDFFPKSIPADMTEAPENAFGVYKKNGGTGEVYHSANLLWYINPDVSRELQVEIDKGHLPLTDVAWLDAEYEKSTINGVDLVIKRSVGHSGQVMFVAEMMYKGNGLRVYSCNLTQTEFVDAVTSLLV